MARTLRCAARGLYKALVQEEQRRLLPPQRILLHGGQLPLRPMSSTSTSTSSAGAAATHPPSGDVTQQEEHEPCSGNPEVDRNKKTQHVISQIKQIEEKKHELFYLLADLDKNSRLRSSYARDNRDLIYELLKHITPNPDDELWRLYRGKERIINFLVYGTWTMAAAWTVSTVLRR